MAPGAIGILVADTAAFAQRYGAGLPVLGPYEGSLSNGGENVELSAAGQILHRFRYNDRAPWPEAADGDGGALTLLPSDTLADLSDPAVWGVTAAGSIPGQGEANPMMPTPGYDDWATQALAEVPESDRLPTADPDSDGLSNLLEYLFASNPTAAALAPSLQISRVGDAVRLAYPQGVNVPDTWMVEIESSNDLVTWSALTADQIQGQTATESTVTVGSEAGHLRLSVRSR